MPAGSSALRRSAFSATTKEKVWGWLFGSTDPKIVSGVVTWAGILLVGLAVHWITRNRSGLCVPNETVKVTATRAAADA